MTDSGERYIQILYLNVLQKTFKVKSLSFTLNDAISASTESFLMPSFITEVSGARTASVHRGRQNQQKMKVPCSCFNAVQFCCKMTKDKSNMSGF